MAVAVPSVAAPDGAAPDGAAPLANPPWEPPPTKLRALVTGGSGLLGRPLVAELACRGFAVFSISSKPWEKLHPTVQEIFVEHSVHHAQVDLAEDALAHGRAMRQVLGERGFDLVINSAADRGGVKYDGVVKRMNDVAVNAVLPGVLAEITDSTPSARGKDRTPMLQVSSEYVWGGDCNTPKGYPAQQVPAPGDDRNADSGAGPADMFVKDDGAPYAVQKRSGEHAIVGYGHVHVVRVPVLYGRMLNGLEDGTAGASINNFLDQNTWTHDTWQKRYSTAAGDCAFVIAALALKCCTSGLNQPVYNYGAQESVSKYQFMLLATEAAGLDREDIKACDAKAIAEGLGKKPPPYDVKLNIDDTRRELLSMPGCIAQNWREPMELDVLSVQTVWLEHFLGKILERRSPDFVPSAELAQSVARALRLRVGPAPIIVIVGGTEFRSPTSEAIVQKIARRIPDAFHNLEATFVTGGMPGVQAAFANSLDRSFARDSVVSIVSAACHNVVELGHEYITGATLADRMLVTGQIGDIYLTVEGGPGVAKEARAAVARGATVVPIIRTGGASEGMFNFPAAALERPAVASEEQWRLVQNNEADLDETAEAVASILAVLVEQTERTTALDRVVHVFRSFDTTRCGRIPRNAIARVLSIIMPNLTPSGVHDLIDAAGLDPGPSESIDYERLIRWVFLDD